MKKILVVLGLSIAIVACNKNDSGVYPSNSAVRFKLTDAPASYDQVNVDIQQVEVKMKYAGGWQNVTTNVGVYDLLELMNGVDTTIVNDSVPTGTIEMIRLVLGPNNTIMKDSVIYPLATPSAMQSGLKINLNKAVNPNDITTILIDFDAHASIIDQGNGNYSLKPVLRIVE